MPGTPPSHLAHLCCLYALMRPPHPHTYACGAPPQGAGHVHVVHVVPHPTPPAHICMWCPAPRRRGACGACGAPPRPKAQGTCTLPLCVHDAGARTPSLTPPLWHEQVQRNFHSGESVMGRLGRLEDSLANTRDTLMLMMRNLAQGRKGAHELMAQHFDADDDGSDRDKGPGSAEIVKVRAARQARQGLPHPTKGSARSHHTPPRLCVRGKDK